MEDREPATELSDAPEAMETTEDAVVSENNLSSQASKHLHPSHPSFSNNISYPFHVRGRMYHEVANCRCRFTKRTMTSSVPTPKNPKRSQTRFLFLPVNTQERISTG